MSLFRRDAGSIEKRAITDLPWNEGGVKGSTFVPVDRALRLGPVYAAGDRLAGAIASMPLQVYRKRSDGSREKLGPPLLLREPSVQGTLHDWIYRAVVSLAYRGNAVGMITARDSFQFPTRIEWLHPEWVQVIDTIPEGPGSFINPIWYYRGRIVPQTNLLHIPWFVMPWKVLGLSPLGAYAATVNAGLSAQEYSVDWFKAGGVPPGTFKNVAQTVEQDDAQTIKSRLVSSIRSHEPIVFGSDWDYTPITVTPHDAQFVETMKLGATQIAAIYGIPPEMIGGETGHSMTYQNVEQQSINFVQFTLLPWLTRLEAALNRVLPRPQYVKFNVNGLIRTDMQTRFQIYERARMIGIMSQDEIREAEDWMPLPNGEGADYTPLPIQAQASVALPPLLSSRD
ncbi:MAG: phage portal protein [Sciscionella sp.]